MDGELGLCPRRGPGLRHHADVTPAGRVCTECGTNLDLPPVRFDIVKRLQELGYMAVPKEEPPSELIEARWITGEGPQGSIRGPGRGAFSPRQRARLLFLAWLRQRGDID